MMASSEDIRQAHRNLARLLHPDNFQDDHLRRLAESQMKRVNGMFEVLADPVRRRVYDQQLFGPLPPSSLRLSFKPATLLPYSGWAVAAVLAVYVIQLPAPTESSAGRAVVPRVEQEEPVRTAAPSRPSQEPDPAEQIRQLRHSIRSLKAERDQAAAGASAGLPQIPPSSSSVPTPVSAGPSVRPSLEPQQDAPRVKPAQRLAGTWIYSPPGGKVPSSELYPAEYVEMVIAEQEGLVWGRCRARYRVTDRALAPEVQFQFQGQSGGSDRFAWAGNGGARGEIQLTLVSENALSVQWYTNQLGRTLSLTSGTATLVRKHEP